jgi:hypothetical protein
MARLNGAKGSSAKRLYRNRSFYAKWPDHPFLRIRFVDLKLNSTKIHSAPGPFL